MASRRTLIGVGFASAAIAAAAVVALLSSGSDSGSKDTKSDTKQAQAPAQSEQSTGEILPLEHKWVITVKSDSNLVIGDPEGAGEASSTEFAFEVVDNVGSTAAKGNERIVRGKIVGATGPLSEPVYVTYVSRDKGKSYIANRGQMGEKGKVMDFADLLVLMPVSIPFDDAIRTRPRSATQKLEATNTKPPPGLPEAPNQPPSSSDLPTGGATPPPVTTP